MARTHESAPFTKAVCELEFDHDCSSALVTLPSEYMTDFKEMVMEKFSTSCYPPIKAAYTIVGNHIALEHKDRDSDTIFAVLITGTLNQLNLEIGESHQ